MKKKKKPLHFYGKAGLGILFQLCSDKRDFTTVYEKKEKEIVLNNIVLRVFFFAFFFLWHEKM